MKKLITSFAFALMLSTPFAAVHAQVVDQPAPVDVQAQISEIRAQLIVLIRALILELQAEATQPAATPLQAQSGINGSMATTDPSAAEKKVLFARGIGNTRAHIYLDDGHVNVSMTDYFEGEAATVAAFKIGQNSNLTPITGDSAETCNGKIADSALNICKTEAAFPIADGDTVRITITYQGVEKSIDISSDAQIAKDIQWK